MTHCLPAVSPRHGVVAIGHVMVALDVGQASAYRRVSACIDRGLLERLDLLRREPSLIRATRAGLRYAGLGMPPAVVSPGAVDHWLRCADAARLLGERHGHHRILTERELALADRHEGRPIASAKIGELPDGRPRLHRPDLVLLTAAAHGGATEEERQMNLRCPECCSEEVAAIEYGARLECGNCGAGFVPGEAFVTVAEAGEVCVILGHLGRPRPVAG